MEIFLKKIILLNFKGIKELTIDFASKTTNIFGKNATGKSTVFDAFTWLLFHKNAEGKTEFSIRTLDESNVPIPKLTHSVTGILSINGDDIEFRKDLIEDWEVQKGNTVEKYTGSHSECFIDGVPITISEYNKRIQKLLPADVFKLITNTSHFCSKLKWQERREMLFKLSKTITDSDVISDNPEFFSPLEGILKKYEIEDYKKKLRESIVKTQEQLKEIPSRIDEAYRAMPELIDVQAITAKITEKEYQLAELDKSIIDVSALFKGYNDAQNEIFNLQNRQSEVVNHHNIIFEKERYKAKRELDKLETEINDVRKRKASREEVISTIEKLIVEKRKIREGLLEKWYSLNAQEIQFSNDDFICPTCKRPFEEHDIYKKKSEIMENYNHQKSKDLALISEQGKSTNSEISTLEQKVSSTKELLNADEKYITEMTSNLAALRNEYNCMKMTEASDILEYQNLQIQIEKLQSELQPPKVDTNKITTRKKETVSELDELKKKLVISETIDKVNTRISELKKQEKELAKIKADCQKQLHMCDSFTKIKIEKMESSVNDLFKYVSFKLFKEHISGGESEICDVLIDGVPYNDANKAAKINAGLDIINSISKFYKVTAPIFIDNRESVNEIINVNSQVINLFVTAEDDKLRVEAI